jgi:hypothetical protein
MAYNGMQINGACDVSQEKDSTATNATGPWTYVCDGWQISRTGTMAFNGAKLSSGGLFVLPNFLGIAINTAQASLGPTDYGGVMQIIEGERVERLRWGRPDAQPLTIGFWTCNNPAGLYSVGFTNGATSRSYVATYTQNVANVSEYKTITVPGITDSGWGNTNERLMIMFSLGCGSNYTTATPNTWLTGGLKFAATGQVNLFTATSPNAFRITGLIVLPGIYAPTAAQSPMIMRTFDKELLLCQRYWFASDLHWQGLTGAAN